MLGWNITVFENETWIGSWDVGPWGAEWLFAEGIKTGDAQIVELKGGYPNKYWVRSRIIPTEHLDRVPTAEWCEVTVWDNS